MRVYIISIFIALILSSSLQAQEDAGDYMVKGLELEKILSLVNGFLAVILFIISFFAYRRDGRSRFSLVSIAFLLFSLKSFLISSELFIPEMMWIEPISIMLEFFVLIFFFWGVIRREG